MLWLCGESATPLLFHPVMSRTFACFELYSVSKSMLIGCCCCCNIFRINLLQVFMVVSGALAGLKVAFSGVPNLSG